MFSPLFGAPPQVGNGNSGRVFIRKVIDNTPVANLRVGVSSLLVVSGNVLTMTPPLGLPAGLKYWVNLLLLVQILIFILQHNKPPTTTFNSVLVGVQEQNVEWGHFPHFQL